MVSMTRRICTTALVTAGTAGALTLAAPASPAAAQETPCVQNVAVINNGGFTMSFVVSNRIGISSTPTDSYAINNFRIVDLTSTPIPEGDDVRPVVSATAGDTVPSPTFVSFCANGQTATYFASGTTLDVTVTLPS